MKKIPPNITKKICVFCGAQNNIAKKFLDEGKKFGKYLSENNYALIYGGGDCGVMGAIANSSLANNGWVIGVFPENLRELESEHENLSEIIIVDSMHTRKELMYKKSNIFVVMSGGFGTMDEMFEILTWKHIGLHNKPIIIYNHDGYWDHLIALLNKIIDEGFGLPATRDSYKVATNFMELTKLINEENL